MNINEFCVIVFKTAARERNVENAKNKKELPNSRDNQDMAKFHATDKTLKTNDEREGSRPFAGQRESTRSSLKSHDSTSEQSENMKNSNPTTNNEKNNLFADQAACIVSTESSGESPYLRPYSQCRGVLSPLFGQVIHTQIP